MGQIGPPAAARGIGVSELVADLACNEEALPADLAALRARGKEPWSPEALAEDARRLAEFDRARVGVPRDEVRALDAALGHPG